MQQLLLTGYLGSDPEMRYTPQGTEVCSFRLGCKVGWGDKAHTQWWKVTCWRKLAETVNEYLHKGSWVMVMGEVQDENGNPRVWQSNSGESRASFEMTANSVDFGPRQGNGSFERSDEPGDDFNQEDPPF